MWIHFLRLNSSVPLTLVCESKDTLCFMLNQWDSKGVTTTVRLFRIPNRGTCLNISMGLLDWIAKKGWRKDGWGDLTTIEKGFTFFLIFDLIVFLPLTIFDLVM